jgi:hypothetical protein
MGNKGMFELVSMMNVAFGNPQGNPLDYETPYNETAWARLESQCKNIKSELKELYDAINARDVLAIRDALCDINVFSLGAHHFMGYDANRDMQSVIDGVMTRFCKDEVELEATKTKYDALGVRYVVEGVFPTVCLKSSEDQLMPEYPKGKFLKSAGYSQPVFYAYRALGVDMAEMARTREETIAHEKAVLQRIESQVAEYRDKLMKEALHIPELYNARGNG